LNNIIEQPTKKDRGIGLTTFLDPTLGPGDRFSVEVEDAVVYNGIYKVTALRHTGDTHGEPFYTEIEAKEWKPAPPPEANVPPATSYTDREDRQFTSIDEPQFTSIDEPQFTPAP
jgi:hypothetical protein